MNHYRTIATPDAPSVHSTPHPAVDWINLTNDEREGVRLYTNGDLPLAAVPPRGQAFVRRHYVEPKE